MPLYDVPGVYIQEITGPGVITGVGTSTAAFIGPALAGPLRTPTVITTFDDYCRMFGRPVDQWPHLFYLNRRFYLSYAVQGFFENGGSRAVILRVGTAKSSRWKVTNTAAAPEEVFAIESLAQGAASTTYQVTVTSTGLSGTAAPKLVATTTAITGSDAAKQTVTVNPAGTVPAPFLAGDIVEILVTGAAPSRNRIASVAKVAGGSQLTLESPLPAGALASIRLAFIDAVQTSVRIEKPTPGIQAGSLVRLTVNAATYWSLVDATDANGFLTLRYPFQQADGSALAANIDISGGPRLETVDFRVKVAEQNGTVLDDQDGLSLDPFHSGYVLRKNFGAIRILPPSTPPATTVLSRLALSATVNRTVDGTDDKPSDVVLQDYVDALKALEDVDDVNIVCIPDAATDSTATIQQAAVSHCLKMKDRVAVLDVPLGREPANSPSALDHLASVHATGGFAALYYPWLAIPEPIEPLRPRPATPQRLLVPPSGHIAGVYARVDQSSGVHYAPANTEVRGVMGLERVLSDREQGLINLEGVNALRIFPGDARVVVWGARTTALKVETDWTYVNVRRLMLYIEESIEEGIRWAVFKPNDRPLWQRLKGTIDEFLERVWQDGALAGAKREQAYQVRVDEGLNPPYETAQGRLFVEIRVAPVRPAEFIIVRIGLWEGGAEVVES